MTQPRGHTRAILAVFGWVGTRVANLWRLFAKWSQAAVVGFRFPHWVTQSPESVTASLAVAAAIAGSMTGVSAGHARGWWIVGTVFCGAAAILIAIARSGERLRVKNLVERVVRELNEDRQNLLGNQLTWLIQTVAEAVAEPDRTLRLQRTNAARAALIAATASLVGRKTTPRTVRANLFEWSDNGHSMMALAPGGFAGRGDRSVRTFQAGDRTFDLAMIEQSGFVRSVTDDPLVGEQTLLYETFLTYPVSIGRDHVHGILTVDSTRSGDIDPAEDVPMMTILTGLLAITYECQKYPNPRNLSGR